MRFILSFLIVILSFVYMGTTNEAKTEEVLSLNQQARAEALLSEPVVEDYTQSLQDQEGLQFGALLLKTINEYKNSPWIIPEATYFTSYNPEPAQTDSTPCIAGGTGLNVCDMAREGLRPIALSQELVRWSTIGQNAPYEAGERVYLLSDNEQCNGEFIVADAMNIRWRNRGDIFCLDRSCNTSCHAVITSLT